jgi:hypothetical protein
MQTLSDKFITYCMSVAKEFDARINRIRAFVKHNLTSGTANEDILRAFLARHSPQAFRVGQGFICNPLQEESISRQCDILIYNQANYPVVYEDGPVKVVWPDAVYMVLETKTRFEGEKIETATDNIVSAKSVGRMQENLNSLVGFVFAFNSASVETVKQHLQKYLPSIPREKRPDAFLLFDKGAVICRSPETSCYSIEKAVEEKDSKAVVLTFLLLHFWSATWNPAGVGIAELLLQMRKRYTEKLGSIELGSG